MTGSLDPCFLCETSGHGKCIGNRTLCECFAGFSGTLCSVNSPETIGSDASVSSNASTLNVGVVVASILGGALLTLIAGLIVFFLCKRRINKKKRSLELSQSTPSSEPVTVSTLYDIPLSRRDSLISSTPTMTYHLYEELL